MNTIPLTLTPESSQLHAYGYDPTTQTLMVQYATNHSQVTYHYKAVPPALAAGLETAQSKGAFIHRQIKSRFDFDRVPTEQEENATLTAGN